MVKNRQIRNRWVNENVKQVMLLIMLSLFSFSSTIIAREASVAVTLSGEVIDESGEPIIGATVQLKGTDIGAATDENGKFTLLVPDLNGTLVISYIGYKIMQIEIGGRNAVKVILEEDSELLSEVVVIGYGEVKKSDLTGAVSSIKTAQLENENPRTIQDMLRGNAAGLDVSLNSSAKGGGDFLVRGRASLNASNSPLIVVDGVIYPGQLSDINPNDIASVDILKDASSAAVFGARSANGVIILSTKKGKAGKPQITFNVNFGKNNIGRNLPLLTPDEFID